MAKRKSAQAPDQADRDLITTELDTTMLVEAAAGTGKTTAMIARTLRTAASRRRRSRPSSSPSHVLNCRRSGAIRATAYLFHRTQCRALAWPDLHGRIPNNARNAVEVRVMAGKVCQAVFLHHRDNHGVSHQQPRLAADIGPGQDTAWEHLSLIHI